MKRAIVFSLLAVFWCCSLSAQGLYSKSPEVTDIVGVWTNGVANVEHPNAIAKDRLSSYVSEHLFEYKNVLRIQSEKYSYKGVAYCVLELYYLENNTNTNNGEPAIEYIVLTEEQAARLKGAPEEYSVMLTQLPRFGSLELALSSKPADIAGGVRRALTGRRDLLGATCAMTARRFGDTIRFNYSVDIWTYNEDHTAREYIPLELERNPDGGYFRVSAMEWDTLF